jgi:hypothetical protein
MTRLRTILISAFAVAVLEAPLPLAASDYVIYSVFKPLDLGNPGENPQKDFYVNMGSNQGLHIGAHLDVSRRVSTYDLMNEKLYQDVTIPIARLKVIHVENNAAVCRLDKLVTSEKSPETTIRAVMVGDIVRPAE